MYTNTLPERSEVPTQKLSQEGLGVKNPLSRQEQTKARRKAERRPAGARSDQPGEQQLPLTHPAAGAHRTAWLAGDTAFGFFGRDYFKEATYRNVASVRSNYYSRC